MSVELEPTAMTSAVEKSALASVRLRWPEGGGAAADLPVTFGVTLPRGAASGEFSCELIAASGEAIAAQGEVLGRWVDGSVRWLLVDAVVPAGTEMAGEWELAVHAGRRPAASGDLRAIDGGRFVVIQSDRLHVKINKDRGSWQASLGEVMGEKPALAGPLGAGRVTAVGELPQLIDERGRHHSPIVRQVCIMAAGPVRATVQIDAEYPRVQGLRLGVRWSFFAGTGRAVADVTLHNPRRARHAGGMWDLGDAGSVMFRDFSLPVGLASADDCRVLYRCEAEQPWQAAAGGRLEIFQESSGGENWSSRNHMARTGKVPLRYRGYRGRAGERELSGLWASPIVVISAASGSLAATIPEFWQQFPKAIEADECRLTLRLFPGQAGEVHELQGGEQKTQRVVYELTTGSDTSPGGGIHPPAALQPIDGSLQTVIPGLPDWSNADSGVLAQVDELAEEFLNGPRGLFANRERVDDYGWRNYGDVHADHEELHHGGPQPLVSHYNNQFDLLAGFLLQHMRTGESRWWELADALARHVIDIDIYHTREDRPAYSGGLFWFTDHYLHAHTSTHRTYSRHNQQAGRDYGGGPAASHNFTTGLLLYHLMTGDPQAKAAVLSLADWVLGMDDGRRTVFGWLDDGATGMASATSDATYHGPGRGAGNSLNALLDGWLASGERSYLDYAETLIRRAIHPREDIAARNLLNAEKRWSYTVFLVSLEKYLRCKAQADELDAMYAYGQESLLAYGRWMLANERPYLDCRDELEYPTEAWPAQGLRKANALRLAAAYAEPSERAAMYQRGDELAGRAWSDLCSFDTRTTARAMAIVLTEGLRDAESRERRSAVDRIPAPAHFPPVEVFVPQRERIKLKLRSPAGIASLLAAALNPMRWPRLLNHR